MPSAYERFILILFYFFFLNIILISKLHRMFIKALNIGYGYWHSKKSSNTQNSSKI